MCICGTCWRYVQQPMYLCSGQVLAWRATFHYLQLAWRSAVQYAYCYLNLTMAMVHVHTQQDLGTLIGWSDLQVHPAPRAVWKHSCYQSLAIEYPAAMSLCRISSDPANAFAGTDVCAKRKTRAGGHVHSLEHGILQGAHVSPQGRWRCRERAAGLEQTLTFLFVHATV